ncbi:MAG: TIGR00282 family metallophosphoesterase [Clostridia bacterium]|nr:TIGR00282 family metallophosphoesterase [Clostridia bacterium]
MKILFIGDIVGRIGCEHLRRILPDFKRRHNVGLVIANGENSADRNGITPETAEHIFTSGVNVITTGNHAFRQSSCNYYYEECPYIIRPANFPEPSYGKGFCIVDMISAQVCVINLLGNVFMNQYGSPFELVDKLIDENSGCPIKIIDFHAEATAEKKAFAYYCDGRVSAVLGTHTHVPTADAQILPNKTAYITDVGMTGAVDSVLGVKKEQSIAWLTGKSLSARFDPADGTCQMDCVLMDIDAKTGRAVSVEQFLIR